MTSVSGGFDNLKLLGEIVGAIGASEQLEGVNRFILSSCVRHFRVEYASIHLQQANTQILTTLELAAANDADVPSAVLRSIVGWVAKYGTTLLSNDLMSDDRFDFTTARLSGIKSAIASPLTAGGSRLGVISLYNRQDRPFDDSDLELLSIVAAQSTHVIEAVRRREADLAARAELQAAHAIQQSLLPARAPDVGDIDAYGISHPALDVGGDYFDWIERPGREFGCVVADVAGKGLAASLLMAQLQGLFKPRAETRESPDLVLRAVNQLLSRTMDPYKFITAWFGVLDPATGTLTFANAGHPSPLLRRADGTVTWLEGLDVMLHPINTNPFRLFRASLGVGDTVIVFSDGVSEAQNAGEELWGLDNIENCIRAFDGGSAEAMVKHILDDLSDFVGGCDPADDITLAVMTRR